MPTGRRTFTDVVKANPLVSVATGFILIVSTITGTLTATGQLDALVVTEAELADFVVENAASKADIDDLKTWNRCDRLERRLDALADRLWRLEQDDDADDDAIRDVERDISTTEREYEALNCARVLAG